MPGGYRIDGIIREIVWGGEQNINIIINIKYKNNIDSKNYIKMIIVLIMIMISYNDDKCKNNNSNTINDNK